MTRQIIAQDVADHLGDAEAAIAFGLAKAAKLLEAMVLAQSQMNVSAVTVEPAMRRVIGTLTALGQAHTELTSAHGRMDQLQRRMGLTPVAVGGTDKPEDGPVTPPHGIAQAFTMTEGAAEAA